MGWLKRLFTSEQVRLDEEILAGLIEDYNAELRLAQQLRAHADEAPYPQSADQLRRLAAVEEAQAARLEIEIRRLGGFVHPPAPDTQGGKNHWARLVCDLDEDRAASKRYLEQAIRWEEAQPEVSRLLRELEHEEQTHRVWLQDLIARSDPHARN